MGSAWPTRRTPYSDGSPSSAAELLDLDIRTDICSLGATMYHLLAGRPPSVGTSAAAVLRQICSSGPPPSTDFAPDLPPELVRIAGGMMATDRELGYTLAAERDFATARRLGYTGDQQGRRGCAK